MGLENVMLKLTDDRPMVEALLEQCTQYTLAYARALATLGADLLSGGDSPAGLLGPRLYPAVALPSETAVIQALHSEFQLPVSLHICGRATPLLTDMARSGAAVLELDHFIDLPAAARAVGPEIALWGNLDPVRVLAQGTPRDVRRSTASLLRAMRESGHRRFVLSSGCTLAMETPAENLDAMLCD